MRSLRPRLILAVAALVHLWLVGSILRQPLDVHVPPRTPRMALWSWYFDSVTSPGPGADFFAVYHAGVQASRGESPYGKHESPFVTPYFYIFRYPPIVAATLGRAVARVSPLVAYRTWVGVLEAILCAFLIVTWRQQVPSGARLAAIAACLLSTPYFLELHMGQFTFCAAAVTALTVFAIHASARGTRWTLAAAVPLAIVTAMKQFTIVAVPGLLAQRRGRPVAVAVVALTLLMLAPMLTDADTRAEYYRLNFVDDTAQLYPGNFSVMYQVYATSVFLGVPLGATGIAVISALGGLAIAATVTAMLWRSGTTDMRRITGTLMAAFFLGYFRVWEHHATAVMVAGVLILASLDTESLAATRTHRSLLGLGFVLLALPTVFVMLPGNPQQWSPAQHLLLSWPKIAGTLAIVLAGVLAPDATRR